MLTKALEINEKKFGPEHEHVANVANNLALLYFLQGTYAKAEPLFTRALAIHERVLGKEHPAVARTLRNYVALLKKTHREQDAQDLEARIAAIESTIAP